MLQYQGFGGIDGVVAGSKHLFSFLPSRDVSSAQPSMDIEKILHDCGSLMEGKKQQFRKYMELRVKGMKAMVLSHGHFDHIGEMHLPYLNGFNGLTFCHDATADLVKLQLESLVVLEANRVFEYNKSVKGKRNRNGNYLPFENPKFNPHEARRIAGKLQGMKYQVTVELTKNAKVTFYDAGHIIGSAQCLYEFTDPETGKKVKVLTAFDLGRSDVAVPIIPPPHKDFPDDIDYCFIESTYGSRKHTGKEDSRQQLEEAVLRGISEKKRMLLGAFSIMRTHSVLEDLFQIYKRGKLPSDFKIYFDSPGAVRVDGVILRHPECMTEQAKKDFYDNPNENPFNFPNLVKVSSREKSEALDNLPGPNMIISASGMWFMGRIVRHLKNHIEDPNALLMLTGYQIPGCTGYFIQQGREAHPVVNIAGQDYGFGAESVRLTGYGAHADGDECVRHVLDYVKPRKRVFIVHGEKEQSEWTRKQLEPKLSARRVSVDIVRQHQVYQLD